MQNQYFCRGITRPDSPDSSFPSQVEKTALRPWISNLWTSQIRGAQSISSSSPSSTGQNTGPSDRPPSALAKSFPATCTSTTPIRRINGATRRATGFSLTHMHTVSSREAGERRMASAGPGNMLFPWLGIISYSFLCIKTTWKNHKDVRNELMSQANVLIQVKSLITVYEWGQLWYFPTWSLCW